MGDGASPVRCNHAADGAAHFRRSVLRSAAAVGVDLVDPFANDIGSPAPLGLEVGESMRRIAFLRSARGPKLEGAPPWVVIQVQVEIMGRRERRPIADISALRALEGGLAGGLKTSRTVG